MKTACLYLVLFLFGLSFGSVIDTTKTDSISTDTSKTYTHINALVETDWSDPVSFFDVKAIIMLENKKCHYITFKKPGAEPFEYKLVKGMVIRLYNPSSKKLIKTIHCDRKILS